MQGYEQDTGFGDFMRRELGNDTSKNQYPRKKIKLWSSRTSENVAFKVFIMNHGLHLMKGPFVFVVRDILVGMAELKNLIGYHQYALF